MDLTSVLTIFHADHATNATVAGVGAAALVSTTSMVVHWLRLERNRTAGGSAGTPERRRSARRAAKHPMHCRQHLLTRSEQAFFSVLEPLLKSHFQVATKVRLADLLREQEVGSDPECRMASECVDFVLTDRNSGQIACAVLLQTTGDATGGESAIRAILESHGIPLLSLSESWIHHPTALRAELLKAGLRLGQSA